MSFRVQRVLPSIIFGAGPDDQEAPATQPVPPEIQYIRDLYRTDGSKENTPSQDTASPPARQPYQKENTEADLPHEDQNDPKIEGKDPKDGANGADAPVSDSPEDAPNDEAAETDKTKDEKEIDMMKYLTFYGNARIEGKINFLRGPFLEEDGLGVSSDPQTNFFGSIALIGDGVMESRSPFIPTARVSLGVEGSYDDLKDETDFDWKGSFGLTWSDLTIPLFPKDDKHPEKWGPSFTLSFYGDHNRNIDESEFLLSPVDNVYGFIIHERLSNLFLQFGREEPYQQIAFEESDFFRIGAMASLRKVYNAFGMEGATKTLRNSDTQKVTGDNLLWEDSKVMAYYESRDHDDLAGLLADHLPKDGDITADSDTLAVAYEHHFKDKPFSSDIANKIFGNATLHMGLQYTKMDLDGRNVKLADDEVSYFAPSSWIEKDFAIGKGFALRTRLFLDGDQVGGNYDNGVYEFDNEYNFGISMKLIARTQNFTSPLRS